MKDKKTNPFEIDFDSYILQSEPEKQENGKLWQTAIGLQQVDGLTPSKYLYETAKRNIDGEITIEEAKELTQDLFTDAVVAMRENFVLRRFEILQAKEGEAYGFYKHMGGKITAVVLLSKDMGDINRGLAMTVASGDPYYLTLEDVPAEDRARELALAKKEVEEDPKLAAKPENVRATIAERKVASRLGDNCLDQKPYALDPEGKLTVAELCKQKDFKVVKFVRYMVGDGIETKSEE